MNIIGRCRDCEVDISEEGGLFGPLCFACFVHKEMADRKTRKVQDLIDRGEVVGLDGSRKCDHCLSDLRDYEKAAVAVVEDRHPSDRGCGVMLCAHHFCKRNGL